ncbi:MAG: hypothetical protein SGBAC_000293 [Bacillariaceae sp.]
MPKTGAPPLIVWPGRKRGTVVDDDMRAALTTGDDVKVELDSSAGMKLPDEYDFVLETHGVGTVSTFIVKYGPTNGSFTSNQSLSLPLLLYLAKKQVQNATRGRDNGIRYDGELIREEGREGLKLCKRM